MLPIFKKIKKKSNSPLNTRNAFEALNFLFPRYSKGANELQPSTWQAMQVSGDNYYTHEA